MTKHTSGENLIIWNFDYAFSTFFEVETEVILPYLPKALSPMEIVPGTSLLNMTAFNFKKGNMGHLPEFQELICSLIVAPDLSRGVPKFAMYVINLTSTCQEHLDHSADYYKLPVHTPLSYGNIDRESNSIDYGDTKGTIVKMDEIPAAKAYSNHERYFQAFVSEGEDLYIADVYIEASLHEHQEIGEAGILGDHSFFKGIEFIEPDPPPYLQMILKPGESGNQYYYRPEKFKP